MGALRLLSFTTSAVAIYIAMTLAVAVAPASAEEPGCAYSSMYLVAHEDDTLLFQSPSLLQDIQTERCVRTVFLTAGDAGRAAAYWEGRESGAEDAYAQMAGVANQWTGSTITANGHPIHLETLKARPSISIVYMRLPDGNIEGQGWEGYGFQSLAKLWRSGNPEEVGAAISSIKAVDNSTTYGYNDLTETLTALMQSFEPRQVYTQNYTVNLIGPDHADHAATGYFSRAASRLYTAPHRLVGFQDYETSGQAQNVTGTLLGGKSAAFYKYGTHDSDACVSEPACTGTSYAKWLLRQYFVSPAKWEATGVVANAGFTQLSEPGATISLDGSGSSAQSGSLQYIWTQTLGPTVSLKNASTATPSFTAPSHPTKIVFSLVAKAGATSSKADTVTIKLPSADPTPTAIAGPTQTVASGAKVQLDGSESWDPNSASLTYAWLQTAGPVVTLTGGSTATPSFTAPTGPATVKFSLMVSNGNQTSAPSTVTVNVNGIVPSFTSGGSAPFTTGAAGSFKVTTAGSPTPTLTRTEGELPPGMTFTANGDGTATIAGTPTAAAAPAAGSQAYPIVVKAANSEGSKEQTLTLNVTNPGTAPLFLSGASTGFTTGVAGSFTVSTSGDPVPTVTKAAGTLPTGVGVTTNADGTLTISGTPAASAAEPGQSQNYALTFRAKSGAGEVTQSFTLTVTNPGTAPAFTSAAATSFTVGTTKTFTISTSGAPAAPIAKVSGSLPPGLTLVDQGNGTSKLSGTATNAAAPAGESQEYSLGLQAKNSAGTDNQTLVVTVTNPGTPPSFSSVAATTFTVGVAKTFTVSTTSNPTAALAKSGTLPTGITFTDNKDGTATLSGTATAATAPPAQSQDYPLSFEASALSGNKSQSFTLTVTNPGTPPSFTSAATASYTTGVPGSFTITTTGAPIAAITKSSGTLPPGLTLTDNGDGSAKISGTPTAAAAPPGESETYEVTVKAQSAAGSKSQTLTLTVTNPGTPPSFTSAAATTFTVGVAKTFTVSTTGAPTAAISKTSGTLPAGLTLADQGDGTAKLSGTPTAAAAPPGESETYEVGLKAQSLAGSKNQALTITVTNPGTGPSFTSIASTGFTTGVAGSFTVATSGDPTPTVTKFSGALPSGVSVTTNANGTLTISGTPAAAAAEPGKSQDYSLTFKAKSAAGEASQSFTLTVTNPGTPPSFTSAAATTFTVGVAKTFTVSTTSNPTAALTKSGTLPTGITFTDNKDGTATLSGTATAATAPPAQSQDYPLSFEASALSGNKSQSFTLTVSNPGTPPSFTSPTSTGFTTGVPGSFKVATGGAPSPALSLTGSGELPSGVTLVDNGDGTATISGTAPASAAPAASSKNYPVTIQAQSGAGKSTQSFTLTVTNPGNVPTITSAKSVAFTTAVAGSFEFTSTGTPTAALTQTGELPTGVVFSDKGNGTATISGTPAASAAPAASLKNYPLTIKASNGAGNVTQTFTLTVNNPGTAPKISSGNSASFTTGVAGSFAVTSTGDPNATLSRTGTLPSGLIFTNKGDGSATIAGIPAASAAPPASSQTYPLTIKALNGAGEATQTLTLTVVNPGTAPEFSSGNSASFTTGVAGSFKITSTGAPTAALSRIEGELPDGLALTDKGDGTATIAGTPVASAAPAAGSQPYPLTIKASSAAGSKTQTLTLTVSNPGAAPKITSGSLASFTTGTAGNFKVVSSGDPTAALTRPSGELPAGVSFTDNGNGTATLSGTPAASAAPAGSSQPYSFTIKATNGAGNDTQSFTLTVSNPGTGPSITSVASTSFTTGVEASFEVTSTGAPVAVISQAAGALPPGVTFSAKANGKATISGTPTTAAAAPGTSQDYPLTLKAQSSVGSVNQDFTLTVVNPGLAPEFTSAKSASFTTGTAGSFKISTSGDPSPALNRQVGNLPDGLSFKDNGDGTATISGSAAASAAAPGKSQPYPLTLRAKSTAGESTQSFTLTVVNTEAGPVFTSASSASFTTGVAKTFTVSTLGNPAAALGKAGELPAGLSFKDNGDGSATISGTAASTAATPSSSRDYPLTINASSGAGNATQPFTLTVVNPEQPVVTPPAEEKRATVDPPKPPEPPVVVEPVRVSLSQVKVLLPIGRYSRRVVQVTAPTQASVTCDGKLPKGARCRVSQRKVVIEASKTVKRTGTFPLTVHVADQSGADVRRRLVVQMLQPDDPALKRPRPGVQSP
ncbi:MAG: large repetitive protein [Solirubrobacterales bacterium]|nr:large repetitive protein [Solirubrobacterales bacterium]